MKARHGYNSATFGNLGHVAIAKSQNKKSSWAINEVLVTYIGILNDIAIMDIIDLCDKYEKTPMYAKDDKFKSILDELKSEAKKRDDFFSNLMIEKEFYCDLKDGANDYVKPIMSEVRDGFAVIYRGAGVLRFNMAADIVTCFTLVQTAVHAARNYLASLQKCGTEVLGVDPYIMTEELLLASKLCDLYVKAYPSILAPSVNMILSKVAQTFQSTVIIKHAGEYAKKYAKENVWSSFKGNARMLFEIKWDK